MSSKLDYAIYDADNHYYEPDDCFSRHIEAKYKPRTMWIDRKSDGPGRMYVGHERCQSIGDLPLGSETHESPGCRLAHPRVRGQEGLLDVSPQPGLTLQADRQHGARPQPVVRVGAQP